LSTPFLLGKLLVAGSAKGILLILLCYWIVWTKQKFTQNRIFNLIHFLMFILIKNVSPCKLITQEGESFDVSEEIAIQHSMQLRILIYYMKLGELWLRIVAWRLLVNNSGNDFFVQKWLEKRAAAKAIRHALILGNNISANKISLQRKSRIRA
jgi:hypothetical protein